MTVYLNGKTRDIAAGWSLRELMADLGLDRGQVAVELNREIVPRGRWTEVILEPDARIEVVHFVGGGARSWDT